MLIKELLNESLLFKDNVTITINPDRDDTGDVADKLLLPLTLMAYKNLVYKKEQHEKRFGPSSTEEDAYNFEDFKQEFLQDEIESIITNLCNDLEKLDHGDFIAAITHQKKNFKYPLDK